MDGLGRVRWRGIRRRTASPWCREQHHWPLRTNTPWPAVTSKVRWVSTALSRQYDAHAELRRWPAPAACRAHVGDAHPSLSVARAPVISRSVRRSTGGLDSGNGDELSAWRWALGDLGPRVALGDADSRSPNAPTLLLVAEPRRVAELILLLAVLFVAVDDGLDAVDLPKSERARSRRGGRPRGPRRGEGPDLRRASSCAS